MISALLFLAFQCPDGSPPPCARAAVSAPAGANSVGVMLFNNVARDTAYAYLAEGLSTEIATTLARVPRLEVRSPGAVRAALRGVEPDPNVVGRRLNVRYVVEGDFQRGGERIRVSVRLVAVPSGTQRWSESYTRPASDLLAVQEDVARSVATAIAGQLLPQERSVLAARPTRSAEAYDHWLRANFQLARRTPTGVARAIDDFGAALRADPAFAQASARIALCYALFLDWGWEFPGLPPDSMLVRGERAADRALSLDSLSADAWMGRGYIRSFRYPRTLEGVLESLLRSTELDPRNAEAWHQYGSWLWAAGRRFEAWTATARAMTLEPGRPVSYFQAAQILILRRDDRAAQAWLDSSVTADPDFYASYWQRTFVRLRLGDVAGARADADLALRTSPQSEQYYGLTAQAAVAAYAGDTVTARALMARAVAPLGGRRIGPLVGQALGYGFVAAGQSAEALDWIERAEPRGALLWGNLQFIELDRIANEPRFVRVIEESRPPGAPQVR